jgi:hypothetical protein
VRDLWAAVVNQAFDDLREFPYDAVEYTQAVEFFTGRGEWAKSREQIADFLELHPDNLRRAGQAVIQARHAADGGPPVKVVVRKPAAPPPVLVVNHLDHPSRPDVIRRLDPRRVQPGLKRPWWLDRKFA